LASAAMAAAVALASCETDGNSGLTRAMKPLSPEMVAEFEQKHMPKESPILVRIFKEESELEIWKQDESGQYALLKSYPICRWSGGRPAGARGLLHDYARADESEFQLLSLL
jgi:murein L,D-transpeptidase YafK